MNQVCFHCSNQGIDRSSGASHYREGEVNNTMKKITTLGKYLESHISFILLYGEIININLLENLFFPIS